MLQTPRTQWPRRMKCFQHRVAEHCKLTRSQDRGRWETCCGARNALHFRALRRFRLSTCKYSHWSGANFGSTWPYHVGFRPTSDRSGQFAYSNNLSTRTFGHSVWSGVDSTPPLLNGIEHTLLRCATQWEHSTSLRNRVDQSSSTKFRFALNA